MKYAIVIPTYNAGPLFEEVLHAIAQQEPPAAQLLIIDSGSLDATLSRAEAHQAQLVSIDNADFDHAATRNRSLDFLNNDISHLVFLTQDAVLASPHSISELLKAFENSDVAAAYGRQLPANNADTIATHSRLFNYPAFSKCENLRAYTGKPSIKAIFSSNSFAAYDLRLFNALDRFKAPSIMSEDLLFAAKAILAGYSLCYQAEATVYHSHNYTLKQQFSRYFDTGYSHFLHRELLAPFQRAENEGLKFIVSEFRYVWSSGQHLSAVCYLPLLTAVRYLAFKAGYHAKRWPKKFNARLSMNKPFWARP